MAREVLAAVRAEGRSDGPGVAQHAVAEVEGGLRLGQADVDEAGRLVDTP